MTTASRNKDIRACVDRILPPEKLLEAADRAVAENRENLPQGAPLLGVMPYTSDKAAIVTGKKWRNGRVLRARFLDGPAEVRARVEAMAVRWSEHANLRFEFGDDPRAEIRISFEDAGSWSYIGTDALSIPMNEPTMNYGWLREDTEDEEYERVVLHEFGHAIGLIHEHQNPAVDIPWDKEAVYRFYAGPPNQWSKEDTDGNLFQTYGKSLTQYSRFDRESIMLYPVPNEHTLGDYELRGGSTFSATDKHFIAMQYPKRAKS